MPSEPGRSDPSLAETLTSDKSGNATTVTPGFDVDSYRTHAGQLLGTPLYMAPEQVDGAQPDERSEVFSLIYAVRPYHWKDQFPKVNTVSKDYAAEIEKKWAGKLPFLKT